MPEHRFCVGLSEVDITPPVGLPMCGSLKPRLNVGIDDPLYAKALVADDGERRVAIVGVDLIGLPRATVDPAIAEAARRTAIDPGAVMVSCSHTHSGPYTADYLYVPGVTDATYMARLPGLIADSIEMACSRLRPATLSIGRSLVYHGLHHRRVLTKEGRALNTWMGQALNDLDDTPQVLGSCGPVDPEMWVLRFDDLETGLPFGAFVNFSLHVNSHFGSSYSADYPGVIAACMRHAFGPQMATVFTPGACGNINPTMNGPTGWRTGAEYFADMALGAARSARPIAGPIAVGGVRRELSVPRRIAVNRSPDSISRLRWGKDDEVFTNMLGVIEAKPAELVVPVNAARIGPFGLASNPGELFVEHGLTIKRRSPFKHTAVAELTNDLTGYHPTREAFELEGYEPLVGANHIAIEGIETLVDTAVELLEHLYR